MPGARDADSDNVYHFTSVNIGPTEALTLRAANMKAPGPVVFLVQGTVTIDGVLSLSGQSGGPINGPQPVPGPGGFTAGHGPGAPGVTAIPGFASTYPPNSPCFGVHATPLTGCGLIYGTTTLLPLIGGSGGGNSVATWGGAGGGAIRIVAAGAVVLNGVGNISASGGAGGGSGGAIHLVAPSVTLGAGTLKLIAGGTGSMGRVRIDAATTVPAVLTAAQITGVFERFPYPDAPIPLPKPGSLQVRVGGALVPANADADLSIPDIQYTGGTPTLEVTAKNIPPGTAVHAVCKPTGGGPFGRRILSSRTWAWRNPHCYRKKSVSL